MIPPSSEGLRVPHGHHLPERIQGPGGDAEGLAHGHAQTTDQPVMNQILSAARGDDQNVVGLAFRVFEPLVHRGQRADEKRVAPARAAVLHADRGGLPHPREERLAGLIGGFDFFAVNFLDPVKGKPVGRPDHIDHALRVPESEMVRLLDFFGRDGDILLLPLAHNRDKKRRIEGDHDRTFYFLEPMDRLAVDGHDLVVGLEARAIPPPRPE